MQLSEIRNFADLINFYSEKDADFNGIRNGEIEGVTDINDDGKLSPWELMSAVNNLTDPDVFTSDDISTYRSLNNSGKVFPTIHLDVDTVIQGVKWESGTDLTFHANGRFHAGTLAENTLRTVHMMCNGAEIVYFVKFAEHTEYSQYDNGNPEGGIPAEVTTVPLCPPR